MRQIVIFLLCTLMFGCVAKRLPYQVNAGFSSEKVSSIIEQVVMEQVGYYRPASLALTNEYLELNYGTRRRIHGGSSGIIVFDGFIIGHSYDTETSKEIKKRLYFNSVLECKLFLNGRWYIVQLVDTEHRVMHNFYARNESKARDFADAIMLLHTQAVRDSKEASVEPESKVEDNNTLPDSQQKQEEK